MMQYHQPMPARHRQAPERIASPHSDAPHVPNDCKVVKLLGQGSFGKVWLVRGRLSSVERPASPIAALSEAKEDTLFVAKTVKLSGSEAERKQALREVQVHASLDHPNIVRLLSYSTVDTQPATAQHHQPHFRRRPRTPDSEMTLFLEYADGGDLSSMMEQRQRGRSSTAPLSEQYILDYLVQIAMALDYVHAKHILHRDIKAENVFLTKSGMVKLGDFGVARQLDYTRQRAFTQVGTPYYLSPEVCDGKPYDSGSDMWSVGVMLYYLMFNKFPFDGQGLRQLMANIVGRPVQVSRFRNSYSSKLTDVLRSLLSKRSSQRPSASDLLKHPLLVAHMRLMCTRSNLDSDLRDALKKQLASMPVTVTAERSTPRASPRMEPAKMMDMAALLCHQYASQTPRSAVAGIVQPKKQLKIKKKNKNKNKKKVFKGADEHSRVVRSELAKLRQQVRKQTISRGLSKGNLEIEIFVPEDDSPVAAGNQTPEVRSVPNSARHMRNRSNSGPKTSRPSSGGRQNARAALQRLAAHKQYQSPREAVVEKSTPRVHVLHQKRAQEQEQMSDIAKAHLEYQEHCRQIRERMMKRESSSDAGDERMPGVSGRPAAHHNRNRTPSPRLLSQDIAKIGSAENITSQDSDNDNGKDKHSVYDYQPAASPRIEKVAAGSQQSAIKQAGYDYFIECQRMKERVKKRMEADRLGLAQPIKDEPCEAVAPEPKAHGYVRPRVDVPPQVRIAFEEPERSFDDTAVSIATDTAQFSHADVDLDESTDSVSRVVDSIEFKKTGELFAHSGTAFHPPGIKTADSRTFRLEALRNFLEQNVDGSRLCTVAQCIRDQLHCKETGGKFAGSPRGCKIDSSVAIHELDSSERQYFDLVVQLVAHEEHLAQIAY
jgi:serine/threonine protein kinase